MAKVKKAFFCRECGNETPKWMGRCPACGEWNTIVEEVVARESTRTGTSAAVRSSSSRPMPVAQIADTTDKRIALGISEVDRVLGCGMVQGSLILLGGEPGIGKSTLSLQLALDPNGLKTPYVSGEETAKQINCSL